VIHENIRMTSKGCHGRGDMSTEGGQPFNKLVHRWVKHLCSCRIRAEDDMGGTLRMAAAVWTDIHRSAIDVVLEMVVAVDPETCSVAQTENISGHRPRTFSTPSQ
jgi:hypothetical protein